MLGAIEAGGTKFVCAVGKEDGTIIERIKIDTLTPEQTMPEVIDFFKRHKVKALGIGSFGPVDIDQNSPTYGNITSTPKPGWTNYPFLKTMKEALHIPIEFNTDVNVAALGEMMQGAAQGFDSCLYITVGTGIGAGAVVQGNLLQGLSHPEMGHVLVKRHPDDTFEGFCPYHKDCLEGMAAGPAIEKRWGQKGHELQNKQEVWEIEAYYLAQALMQYILTISPKKIIMGGGVMKQAQIFPLIRKQVQELLNGYVPLPQITEHIEDYIVPPALGDDAGITGALMLAKRALEKE
ncbi:ROK family protein [Lederbergia wuyishanensis]|uniref:fructokinase n=1 Tax=Lederbergia wuyishanensis TaxID=1347903 RepID=A0ABU0D8V2_9BACI|nr:ROK family protein [Lederbergia wuyishanensis]MCJ8007573.1 ROK family protein [Lederbergia wuyishanensis]MDQ0344844.1 fructokinase [Lederbergia wuyishanensis]